jgi:hypothetical protein
MKAGRSCSAGDPNRPLADRLRDYYSRNGLDYMADRAPEVAAKYADQEQALWRKLRAKYGDIGGGASSMVNATPPLTTLPHSTCC